jgi:hypothetical protein
MKWLGFRAAFLYTDNNAEARTKLSQTTELHVLASVCCVFVLYFLGQSMRLGSHTL